MANLSLSKGGQATVIRTQYGHMATAVVKFSQLKSASYRVGSTDDEDENAGAVQRETARVRVKKMKSDFIKIAATVPGGKSTQIITEALHLNVKTKKTVTVGESIHIERLFENASVELVDGAGRWNTLMELCGEDPEWNDHPVLVQLYLNIEPMHEVLLMENLNSKRAKLEKNFHTYLRSVFFRACSIDSNSTFIDEEHVFAHLAFEFANRTKTPWVNRIRFHDSEGVQKTHGLGIASIASNFEKAEKSSGNYVSRLLEGSVWSGSLTSAEVVGVYCAIWNAIQEATGDLIFSDNFHEWKDGASTMFQCLLSGGLRATAAICGDAYLTERRLKDEIVRRYGDVIRDFVAIESAGVHSPIKRSGQKFCDIGGTPGMSRLVSLFNELIDARTRSMERAS